MDDLFDPCRERIAAGADLEDVLRFLRDVDASRSQSMHVLVSRYGMGLGAAKAALHLSAAWSDLRESTDRFQEELDRSLSAVHEHLPREEPS